MKKTMLMLATATALAVSGSAWAQTTNTPRGSSSFPGDPNAANGVEQNRGPDTQSYGTRQHMGREQPEQKQDMGSGSGKK